MSIPTRNKKRRFWVISPNVTANENTIDLWKEAIRQRHVAFMGYGPKDPKHKLGSRFAKKISKGDVILIARRKNGNPDVVGLGIVSKDESVRKIRGFTPPDKKWRNGSIRQLSPFVVDPTIPPRVPIKSILNHTQSLCQLHPSWRSKPDHLRVCGWLSKRLGLSTSELGRKSNATKPEAAKRVVKRRPHRDPAQFDFSQRSAKAVRKAIKREDVLVGKYKTWLEGKGRKVDRLLFDRFQCDAHERVRNNLIEAKSSDKREYIRMAVGQLLDYAFLGKDKLGNPNMAILLPKKPEAEILTWLLGLKIHAIWKQRNTFADNAGGRFI